MSAYRTLQEVESRRLAMEERRVRAEQRRARLLAKQQELKSAEEEVADFESQLQALLSVHKECSAAWDWPALLCSLPPPCPVLMPQQDFRIRRKALLPHQKADAAEDSTIVSAKAADQAAYESALGEYSRDLKGLESLQSLARRVLSAAEGAYTEALTLLNPFGDLGQLGSSIRFVVHSSTMMECILSAAGEHTIPSEIKILGRGGKLRVRPLAKRRLFEMYQDFLCGCVLRVAREVFALLPVDRQLITANVEKGVSIPGEATEVPVLSVIVTRAQIDAMDFETLDPSDTIDTLFHRGDFKASRKEDAFRPIIPLTVTDVDLSTTEVTGFPHNLELTKRLRERISKEILSLERVTEQMETSA